MNVTTRFGTREITRTFPPGSTIRTVRQDRDVRLGLGLPESVQAFIDGVQMSDNDPVSDGCVVTFEKQAAQKAS